MFLIFVKVIANRVMTYLLRHRSIDVLFLQLQVAKMPADYRDLITGTFVVYIATKKMNQESARQILLSEFIRWSATQVKRPDEPSGQLEEILKTLFNRDQLQTIIELAVLTPDYLVQQCSPILERIIADKLEDSADGFDANCENYLINVVFESERLSRFPSSELQLQTRLLASVQVRVDAGHFNQIGSIELLLKLLGQKTDVPFLRRASMRDLQKSLELAPARFFQNLYQQFSDSRNHFEIPQRYRRSRETVTVVENIEIHLDHVHTIIRKTKEKNVPLDELKTLFDPQVSEYLKQFGLTDREFADIRKASNDLKARRDLYEGIYHQFSELESNRQVLVPEDWEHYLEVLNCEQSNWPLRRALDEPTPFELRPANWLASVKDCRLFWQNIFQPALIEASAEEPIGSQDFQDIVVEAASAWIKLAERTARGTIAFAEMEEILTLAPNAEYLSERHLEPRKFRGLPTAYQDFTSLREIRHQIGPFVAALRYFTIENRRQIDSMYTFIQDNLINNWPTTTLETVMGQTDNVRYIRNFLRVDRTKSAMEFLSSLVTDADRSPLIEFLIKTTRDPGKMEAIGRIVQGTMDQVS